MIDMDNMSETSEDSVLGWNSLEMESGDHETEKKEAKTRVPFYKLFAFSDSVDKALMIIAAISTVANGLSQPLMALIFGGVVDAFGRAGTESSVVSLISKELLKFIYVGLGCGAAAFLQVSCWTITGNRQSARMRSLYLETILRQDIAYFDQEVSTGEVIRRMSEDIILIQDAIGEKVGTFVRLAASCIGGFVVALAKGWLLTLVMLTSIPLLVASSGVMYFVVFRKASEAQKAYDDAANVVQQTVASIRTVASFNGETEAMAKYKKLLITSYKSDSHVVTGTGLGVGFLRFFFTCTYALAVWFGAKLILHNGYTGGQVCTILLAVITGSSSLGQISAPILAFSAGQRAEFKIFETINRKPMIDAYDPKGKILGDIHGDIELQDVSFSYPARPQERILDKFSLFIRSGTSAALVGQSGSGKSTVISLIERFYDPLGGAVLIDGTDLRQFQLKWIRSKIGLVSQEPVLFTASIMDNIAYGKEGATLEEIRAAAELSNARDFIDKLPQGLDTMVGEHGIQLSGGQKQRVAIARVILKDPRILLLDEATSALDSASERVVQEALEKIMVDRTTVMVAHRLSTVRNANMIALLHKGKIVEKGTHNELLKDPEGMYSKLVYSQEANENEVKNIDKKDMADIMNSSRVSSQRIPSKRSEPCVDGTTISNSLSPHNADFSLYRLARLNKPETLMLTLGAICGFITGATLPLFGLLISFMLNTFFELPHDLKKDSEFWALMFLILGLVSLITYPLGTHLFSMAGNKLIQRIRLMCFEKVVKMEIGWFDMPENSSGVISTRLSTDAAMVRALVGDALAQYVQQVASIVVGLVIAFQASWQLALIILAMIPFLGSKGYLQMKSIKGFIQEAKLMYEEASQMANDAVGNIRTVASFCAQQRILGTYKKKCEGLARSGTKQGLIGGIGSGSSTFLLFLVYATSLYAAARFVDGGKISTAQAFRVFFALSMVAVVVSSTSASAADSSKAKIAATSIFGILDRKSKIDPSDESGMIPENVNGEIELRNVSFSYPTRPHIPILIDFSLTISSGKIVALVGESGSGKSTVISLLQRFYDPDSGHITLDGTEIRKLPVKWLRQQMGLVSQEPVLFNDTIRANIACGNQENATEYDIIAAAKLANAHEFICGLKQGYNTTVGERGIQLSGGQKQRVAIARAIMKRPKILLLDEATSALDTETEKIVQEALNKVMVNRTTIVVAHRLSTIRAANVIAVFRNGRIVEKGNHNTLMSNKYGFYSSLVTLHNTALP